MRSLPSGGCCNFQPCATFPLCRSTPHPAGEPCVVFIFSIRFAHSPANPTTYPFFFLIFTFKILVLLARIKLMKLSVICTVNQNLFFITVTDLIQRRIVRRRRITIISRRRNITMKTTDLCMMCAWFMRGPPPN